MEFLTVQETATLLKVSPITIRRYIGSGRLPAVRIGRAIRVQREAVEELLEPVVPKPDEELLEDPNAGVLTPDDSLFNIIGMFKSEGPGDVSRNKHKYITEDYFRLHYNQDDE